MYICAFQKVSIYRMWSKLAEPVQTAVPRLSKFPSLHHHTFIQRQNSRNLNINLFFLSCHTETCQKKKVRSSASILSAHLECKELKTKPPLGVPAKPPSGSLLLVFHYQSSRNGLFRTVCFGVPCLALNPLAVKCERQNTQLCFLL